MGGDYARCPIKESTELSMGESIGLVIVHVSVLANYTRLLLGNLV